jgi:hypothetical protein
MWPLPLCDRCFKENLSTLPQYHGPIYVPSTLMHQRKRNAWFKLYFMAQKANVIDDRGKAVPVLN